jgi:hypothetical protein
LPICLNGEDALPQGMRDHFAKQKARFFCSGSRLINSVQMSISPKYTPMVFSGLAY